MFCSLTPICGGHRFTKCSGISNDRGLTEVLRSDRAEPPLVQVSPSTFPCCRSGNRSESLAGLTSERMRSVPGRRRRPSFDWVLLDTPPVGLLPDAQLLGRMAQAAIFVIRAGVDSISGRRQGDRRTRSRLHHRHSAERCGPSSPSHIPATTVTTTARLRAGRFA